MALSLRYYKKTYICVRDGKLSNNTAFAIVGTLYKTVLVYDDCCFEAAIVRARYSHRNESLIFHRGRQLFSSSSNQWQPLAFLSGQGTGYTDVLYSGVVDMISVVFKPAGARVFFNRPMIELNEQSVSLDDLSDPLLLELNKRLTDSVAPQACVQLIEQFLFKRLYLSDTHNQKRMNAVVQRVYCGEQSMDALAQTACLGYKQFKRVFANYVGANPKDFLRVVRFQKALHLLQNSPTANLTQVAYECGYYDQAHFINDFKRLSGYTPTVFLNVCAPYSDFFS